MITLCRDFIVDIECIMNIVFHASEVKETFQHLQHQSLALSGH